VELIDRAKLVVEDRVQKLITEGTADAIALKFIELGIKAVCGNPQRCAIAVYLNRELTIELGADHGFYVSVPGGYEMTDIELRDGEAQLELTTFSVGVLGRFAEKFDDGHYRELTYD
jgi:hypothetical protein